MARPSHRPGNLPAEVTSFVGRRRELGEIRKQLAASRMVSLVGPGGVGKTRLAVRAAGELGRGFADGAWVVELAEVRDAALVSNALLAALDLRDLAATKPFPILVAYLQDKRLLLVVDNCEHLLEGAARVVTDLLRAAPNLRVIATSREPLQVAGEQVIPLSPLELPRGDGTEPLGQLQQNEAVALFSERAAAASGAFELTSSNQAAVVALCRRLDGLPLAIELAAVRTRVLSPEQILDRLGDRFALLTGGARAALPRHQTLRLAIDWSFELLTDTEQTLFRRLCLFAGRFTLDDVDGLLVPDEQPGVGVLDLLGSLVDKSLVTKEDVGGAACYRLHETIREYASLKLDEADEAELLTERWLEHYRTTCLRLADGARYHLVEWLAWADLEIDNLREVLGVCLRRGELSRGLDVAVSMRYYWITHGTTEAVRWLDQLLTADDAFPATLVRAYYLRGWLSLLQGDPVAARPWIARAIATARTTGQVALLSESLSIAATNEDLAGDPEAARGYLDEAEVITSDLNDFPATIELVLSQSVHAIFQRDFATVTAASLEGVRLGREAGDLFRVESMLGFLGMVGLLSGDNEAAHSHFVEALQVARHIDNRLAQYYGLAAAGWYASTAGHARPAAQLLGAAETLATQTGADMLGPSLPFLESAKESARESLGAPSFDAAYATGKRMSRDAALRLALDEPAPLDASAAEGSGAGPLAKREVEVAQLIADGMSNKQIGARLFISEATVASHVRHIMDKLGFSSRSQIAVWMTSANLATKR
jgi:predicted ATPase/DNA-binding CsgD family transcriptional regulator